MAHLVHPAMKIYSPQNYYSYSKKAIFHARIKKLFYISYTCPKKEKFSKQENFLLLQVKTIFQTNNFLYLSEILISYIFTKKPKHLKHAFYFSKPIIVLTKHINQCLFLKHFYFPILCNIFFIVNKTLFSSSGKFYIVCNHIVAFSFSLFTKDLDTFLRAFSKQLRSTL